MSGSAGSEWSWGPADEDEELAVMLAGRDDDDLEDDDLEDDDLDDDLDEDDLDDDDDDDLIDLDDEYDDADEEERPHPGRFEE